MPMYRVAWEIDLEAATPREAAEAAREIQLDLDSTANVFDVRDRDEYGVSDAPPTTVDLDDEAPE